MPVEKKLEAGSPWVELTTTDADWKAADPQLLMNMLGQMHLIRAFEESVLELAGEAVAGLAAERGLPVVAMGLVHYATADEFPLFTAFAVVSPLVMQRGLRRVVEHADRDGDRLPSGRTLRTGRRARRGRGGGRRAAAPRGR